MSNPLTGNFDKARPMKVNIPTPEELDRLNENTPRPIIVDYHNDPEFVIAAVHAQLEDLTPPEAIEVLNEVIANLKAEVRDFNADRDADATSKRADGSP